MPLSPTEKAEYLAHLIDNGWDQVDADHAIKLIDAGVDPVDALGLIQSVKSEASRVPSVDMQSPAQGAFPGARAKGDIAPSPEARWGDYKRANPVKGYAKERLTEAGRGISSMLGLDGTKPGITEVRDRMERDKAADMLQKYILAQDTLRSAAGVGDMLHQEPEKSQGLDLDPTLRSGSKGMGGTLADFLQAGLAARGH